MIKNQIFFILDFKLNYINKNTDLTAIQIDYADDLLPEFIFVMLCKFLKRCK
jgi:hypothetical protein